VVVQDTGFTSIIPGKEGIVAFNTAEEAVAAIKEVEGNYEHHAGAARIAAYEYFDSGKVLSRMIEDIFG
jgi:hypothetical protein